MSDLHQNIELKTHYVDLNTARCIIEQLGAQFNERQVQTDTYFCVPNGRLKLREIEGQTAVLIGYCRPDQTEFRTSNYYLIEIQDPSALKAALTTACGARGEVRKTRDILLYHNVRIHLDRVENLGTFIEFEAVLSPGADESGSLLLLDQLYDALKIDPSWHCARSYSDMLGI